MIFLALPCHRVPAAPGRNLTVEQFKEDFPTSLYCEWTASLLCYNFNALLATALNARSKDPAKPGITHFLLLHDDVRPMERHWASQLFDEMQTHKLGALAVDIPIKNQSRQTSTALDSQKDDDAASAQKGHELRKFQVGEIAAKGGTITSREEPRLLINTGMLLIDVTQKLDGEDHPWVDDFHFTIRDGIVRLPDGKFEARCAPEDWMMSRWMASKGISFGVTSKIKVLHYGPTGWANWKPDGN